MKEESESCLQWLVGEPLQIPTYQKRFKKSTYKLESQQSAQTPQIPHMEAAVL
jgi:hypothetical protein